MKSQRKSDTMALPIESGWVLCPTCRRAGIRSKLLHLSPEIRAEHFPLWCRKCGGTIEVNIERGQCSRSPSP